MSARKLNLTTMTSMTSMNSINNVLPYDVLGMIAEAAVQSGDDYELQRTCKAFHAFKRPVIRQLAEWSHMMEFEKVLIDGSEYDFDFSGALIFQGGPRSVLDVYPNASCIVVVDSKLTSADLAGFTGSIVLIKCTLESELNIDCASLVLIDCVLPQRMKVGGEFPIALFINCDAEFPSVRIGSGVRIRPDIDFTPVYSFDHPITDNISDYLIKTYGVHATAALLCCYGLIGSMEQSVLPLPDEFVEYIRMLVNQFDRAAVLQRNLENYMMYE